MRRARSVQLLVTTYLVTRVLEGPLRRAVGCLSWQYGRPLKALKYPPGGTAPNHPVHSTACIRLLYIACGIELAASLTIMKERSGVLSYQAPRHVCHKTALQIVALRLRHRLGAHQIRRFAPLLSITPDGTELLVEAIGGDTVTGGMAVAQEKAFADLFEAAFLEESMSLDSMDEASAASTSINLLSLGPNTSAGCELTRQFSTGPGEELGSILGPFLASNGLLSDIYRVRCPLQTCRSCTLWSRLACRMRRGNGSMSASPSRGALQSRADHHRCRSPCTAYRSS